MNDETEVAQSRTELLRAELDRRKALENCKNDLATKVYELVKPLAGDAKNFPERSQLQNLRTLAVSTDSVEELKIYIEYQITRKVIPQMFGNSVIKSLGTFQNDMDQVRLFLGYLYRHAARFAR